MNATFENGSTEPEPESSPSSRPADGGPGPFEVGRVVNGAYRIDGVLGRGGMGIVYEATDCHLPRRVALKVPANVAFTAALRNEAQALAAIRHPAFPAVYQFGFDGDIAYLAMERIFGDLLDARLRSRRESGVSLSIVEVLELLIAVTDALAAAHRVSVTHRDLKPSNIILSGERVILIDLGLFVPEPLVGPGNLIAGSLQSIAPEVVLQSVVRGRAPLIDLYALGALAYELLVGSPPFTGETTQIVLAKHVCAEIPDPRDARADIPRALAELVTSLLAKDPCQRPMSAESVLWQLKEVRGAGTLQLRPTNVLVVDDDHAMGQAVQRILEQGYPNMTVRATTEPSEALPGAGTHPDIVILDLNMPGINGAEICMALRSMPAEQRPAVIVMSSSASPEDIALLEGLGVQSFFPKDESLFVEVGNAVGSIRSGERTSWHPPVATR